MKTLYFDCSSGISGNMTLGALLEIVGDENYLLGELKKLNVDGYKIEISKKVKNGITGTYVDVILENEHHHHDHDHGHAHDHEHHHHHEHRNLYDVNTIIDNSSLDENTKDSKQKEFDYLNAFVTEKNLFNTSTIKGSQFVKPKFAYCGACSGCGEPAYIKLLTQLFGKQLIVANATGCSSIYGGSAPVTPYSIPWANSLFEDNAEYGFGIYLGISKIRKRIYKIMSENMDNENAPLFKEWIDNSDDYEITNKVYQNINYDVCPKELTELKNYITASTIWAIGGDGWAYDIGFSGIDHVLSSNENINILVLDTQVYSNTGGQSSKASPKGAIAAFASNGKKQSKKDLARIAMAYPNAYVAQVSLGYNGMQLIKTFNEAKNHNGPSIIIAYCPCISHGIDGGLKNSVAMEKLAVESGYFPVFRRNPDNNTFIIDCNPNFDLYSDFLSKQTRYKMLNVINKEHAEELLKENKENAIKRYEYYKSLETR